MSLFYSLQRGIGMVKPVFAYCILSRVSAHNQSRPAQSLQLGLASKSLQDAATFHNFTITISQSSTNNNNEHNLVF
jgi:hypothetical protein